MSDRRGKLCLFIASNSSNGRVAVLNVRKALDRRPAPRVEFEVIDVDEDPDLVLAWRIFATPTLLWSDEPFGARLVGDLSAEVELAAFLL